MTVSAWLLRLAEAVELTGLQQPELLIVTLEVSLALGQRWRFRLEGESWYAKGAARSIRITSSKPVRHLSL